MIKNLLHEWSLLEKCPFLINFKGNHFTTKRIKIEFQVRGSFISEECPIMKYLTTSIASNGYPVLFDVFYFILFLS